MAADDIFSIRVHYELPTSAASFGLYYRETTEATGTDLDTEMLGDAFDTFIGQEILDMLSDDCNQPLITCEKVDGPIKAPRHDVDHAVFVGQLPGPSLPNNNALNLSLFQATFDDRSNGRIRIPGIPEPSTNGTTMLPAFLDGPANNFVQKLVQQIPELSAGPGRWTLGVISAKVRDVALPAKDWDAAFAPVTSVSLNTIIGILRSRRTRADGVSGTTP